MKKVDKTLKLFEGSYHYFNDGEKYSEENFIVHKSDDRKHTVYASEQLTRVGTGEFLKIETDYEVDHKFNPFHVKIDKHLGQDFTTEHLQVNLENNTLTYQFENGNDETVHQTVLNVPNKFQLVTPAFITSTLYSYSTKHNAMGRSGFYLIKTQSDWEYVEEFAEFPVYGEFLTHEKTELKINDQDLSCVKMNLYKHDIQENVQENPVCFYISRHIGIPYMMESPEGITIKIKNLQKFENFYEGMF